jgi:hypothetical protein
MGRKLSAALGAALIVWLAGPGELRAADPDRRVACVAQVVSRADLRALRVLQQPPFAPTDVSLFTPQVYPSAPPTQPAGPYSFTEESLRARLSNLLAERFRGQSRRVRAGLAVYDSAAIKAVVPDPRLRTALALLSGTAGEAAIRTIQGGVFDEVRFGPTLPDPFFARAIAFVTFLPGDLKPTITFVERYEYEDPLLLANYFAHEALHQDRSVNSSKEELVNDAIDVLVGAQLLLEAPGLAASGTELARRLNTKILVRLNSRDTNGLLRLFMTQGDVLPGSAISPASFGSIYEPLGADTPGNAALRAMLRAVTGSSPRNPDFDDRTLALLDQCQRLLSPSEVLRLARILRLDTSG